MSEITQYLLSAMKGEIAATPDMAVKAAIKEIQRLQAELAEAKEWGQCFHTAGLELAEENKRLTERFVLSVTTIKI